MSALNHEAAQLMSAFHITKLYRSDRVYQELFDARVAQLQEVAALGGYVGARANATIKLLAKCHSLGQRLGAESEAIVAELALPHDKKLELVIAEVREIFGIVSAETEIGAREHIRQFHERAFQFFVEMPNLGYGDVTVREAIQRYFPAETALTRIKIGFVIEEIWNAVKAHRTMSPSSMISATIMRTSRGILYVTLIEETADTFYQNELGEALDAVLEELAKKFYDPFDIAGTVKICFNAAKQLLTKPMPKHFRAAAEVDLFFQVYLEALNNWMTAIEAILVSK